MLNMIRRGINTIMKCKQYMAKVTRNWKAIQFYKNTLHTNSMLDPYNPYNGTDPNGGSSDYDYIQERYLLKQEVIEKAFELLTETQLTVFLMVFVFGMKQSDVANNLRSNKKNKIKRLPIKKKCGILLKCDKQFVKEKNDFYKQCLLEVKQNEQSHRRFATKIIGINKDIVKKMNVLRLSRAIAGFKFKRKYNNNIRKILKKFGSRKRLDREVNKNISTSSKQSFVSVVLKQCVRKLKKYFDNRGGYQIGHKKR